MEFDIELAKTYFRYTDNVDKAAEIEQSLTNALVPAKNQFKSTVGIDEFIRYNNATDTIVATSKETDNITFNYDDALYNLRKGDYVTIDTQMYKIVAVSTGVFVIDKVYTGAELTFTINSVEDYKSLFAWILVYNFTFTVTELILDIVMRNTETFGDNTIEPADIRLNKYRKFLKDNIKREYSIIKSNLGIKTYLERA